jgi:TonB-linked SusC/RagA family outer membrane protein
MRRSWWVVQFVSALATAIVSPASPQAPSAELQVADAAPAFYQLRAGEPVRVDVRSVAALQQQIALDLDNTTLPDAVDAVSHVAHILIFYTPRDVPSERRITLQATKISVAGALRAILADADLDVEVSREGTLTLAPRHGLRTPQKDPGSTVTLRGVVTDALTRAPLQGASVSLDGTSHHTTTGVNGSYRLPGVPPGLYTIVVRRLGYLSLKRSTTVALPATAGEQEVIAKLDVALTVSPGELDEVVTTVTGDQRRAALGNAIATIDAASVVGAAAASSLSDILNARASGVQVFNPGGLTGASPQIDIRGESNLRNAGNQPLIYIDGVRISNDFSNNLLAAQSGMSTGRLNDISPEEIASIEIVKGPSAATLYGTDAANGVILITTKHASAPGRQWDAFAEAGVLTVDRNRFPDNYTPWGHSTDGTNTVEQCPLLAVAANTCVQDSITTFTPLKVPSLTPLGTGSRGDYGLQVSQGGPIRYFVSGNYENETGYLKMPTADREIYEALRGGQTLSSDELHPNYVDKYSGRVNLATALAPTADFSLSVALLQNNAQVPSGSILALGEEGPGSRDSPGNADGWLSGIRPGDYFVQRHKEDVTHFTAGATTSWAPFPWLSSHATFGIDRSNNYEDDLTRAGEGLFFQNTGLRANGQTNNTLYSADLGATATLPLLSLLNSRTSVGGQFIRSESNVVIGQATNLLPGQASLSGGATSSSESISEGVVAGGYVEEVLSYRDRLFLTGAVRADGSASFGKAFGTALYPKASASWQVSRESFWPVSERAVTARLRGAYGESGVQPLATGALARLSHSNVFVDGQTEPGFVITQLANPNLKPERTSELEYGMDLDLLDQRIHLEGTYYYKRTSDAIVGQSLGNSVGSTFQYANIGAVRNSGWEVSANVRLVNLSLVTWDVSANGSINQNRVLTLGPFVAPYYGAGEGTGTTGMVAGFPLYGAFSHRIVSYADRNGNGILEPGEIAVDSGGTPTFRGSTYPLNQLTVGTSIGLLHNHLRIRVQFDHRGDYRIFNTIEFNRCVFLQACVGTVFAHAPLNQQAAAVAAIDDGSDWGYWQDGTFTRLRDLSVTYQLPDRLARTLHLHAASVTLSGRNLALWTKYPGVDPEVVATQGNPNLGEFNDFGSIPPAQYYVVRVNLGL